jgi:enoyl-CoA hydratase
MAFSNLLVEDVNGVRWLTINRPTKLNALNREVMAELQQAVSEFLHDDVARALVLTGAGEKAFVAGADIAEFIGLDRAGGLSLAQCGQGLYDALESSPKLVIAAVNGFALGGGCELALACHLRIAAANARFGQPEVKLGLIPGYGGTQRLPRLVGKGRALEMLLSGEMINAEKALAWGLVNRIVEPAELRSAAQALAELVLAVSPSAVARCLRAVNAGLGVPFDEGEELEASLFAECFDTADMKEGTAAFAEKRPAKFTGK